jgi:four helix bundle protein
MGAHRFEDLECWKLANALKLEVYAVIDRPEVRRDFSFCEQIRESASSGPANIAEGFGRFRPLDFARFLEFAKGSLSETSNHLLDARDRRHLSAEEAARLRELADEAARATTGLIAYLRGPGKRGPR